MNDTFWQETVWSQFGAAIDALENAIHACPDDLWDDRTQRAEFWYMVSHTLFWLDYYLSESFEDFVPPEPFGMEEMDPAGAMPPRPYTKAELQSYLEHGRAKCRARLIGLTDTEASRRIEFGKRDLSVAELLLYNMRHVQHHSAQLNFILREETDSAPRWTFKAKTELE